MGRARKETHERRDERFGNPRYTIAEKAEAVAFAHAAGLDPSEYVRRRVLGWQMPQVPARQNTLLITELNRLGVELRAVGNNVNQLARSANAGRESVHVWQAVSRQLQAQLAEIEVALERLSLGQ